MLMLHVNPATPSKIEHLPATSDDLLAQARRAAEAHRRSRQLAQQMIKPGVSLLEIATTIENSTRTLLKGELNNGIGFPTGLSLNDCAAHYTPNPGDADIFLCEDDVLKVDFGTHVNGIIMDSAFTVAFNDRHSNLLLASKEATEAGIKALGVDVRVTDIGGVIAEVMGGFEVIVDGNSVPVKPVSNLNGHSIDRFMIHADITIPNVRNGDNTRIKDNTFYAIETFATTGNAYVRNGPNPSHYIYDKNAGKPIKNETNKKVLDVVKKNLKTLPFCPRYVDTMVDLKNGSLAAVRTLSLLKHFESYPPLYDIKGSFVAQFEHTIWLGDGTKEVLTRVMIIRCN